MRNDITTPGTESETDPQATQPAGLVILAADDAAEATCTDDLCLPATVRPAEPIETTEAGA